MNKILKLFIVLIILTISISLYGCKEGTDNGESQSGITVISFKNTNRYEDLVKLDNKQVSINGYMATSSPVDGSFIFLMNLPYQSCPFCKPNTTELSNTIEAYPKKNQKFTMTTQAIRVVGTLKVAPQDNYFTDRYGYEFAFKIVDAEYEIIKESDLDGDAVLRTKVADAGIITEIYKMFDYLNFTCRWNTYYVNTYTDSNGNEVTGFYLYASDAINFITKDGAQYNYGYKDGYFEKLIAKIKKIDPDKLNDLVKVIEDAKKLSEEALKELFDGNYTSKKQYVEKFDKYDYIYTLNKEQYLVDKYESIYYAFSDWYGI